MARKSRARREAQRRRAGARGQIAPSRTRLDPGTVALGAAVALAVAFPVLWRGGFYPFARAAFVALAGLALLIAIVVNEDAVFRALRSPPVVVLAVLGAVSVASAAWSIAVPGDAVRAGLVILGFGGLTVAATVLTIRQGSATPIAAVIVALAAFSGAAGLVDAALRGGRWAEYVGGSWRPGGTFEYPPTLALLEVSALPWLLTTMTRARVRYAAPAAAGLALAAGVLAISVSRLQIALAALLLATTLLWPSRTLGSSRWLAACATALALGAGLVVHLALGGRVPRADTGGHSGRLAAVLLTVAVAPLLWAAARRLPDLVPRGLATREPGRRAGLLIAALASLIAIAVVAVTIRPIEGRAIERSRRFTHNRTEIFKAALETAADRPVYGTGTDGFLQGSLQHQDRRPTRYAHDLPLEQAAELGLVGAALALALYAACTQALLRARRTPAVWLLGPAVAAFLVTNLLDWPWHFAGAGAVFAASLGGLIASRPRAGSGSPPTGGAASAEA